MVLTGEKLAGIVETANGLHYSDFEVADEYGDPRGIRSVEEDG
jgi:hypothetical protein